MPTTLPRVSSRHHPLVQRCRLLARGRRDEDRILLDGAHVIEDALSAGDDVRVESLLVADDRAESPDVARLLDRARAAGVAVYAGSAAALDAASPVRTATGLVAVARWSPAPVAAVFVPPPALAVALVDVQDPGNVGAAIRSADALGATGLVACGQTADPASWKALRGAMGSTFRVPVARADLPSLVEQARAHGVRIAAAVVSGGVPLAEAPLDTDVVMLLGHEGAGLSANVEAYADFRVTIPMRRGVNSLNVGVTAALVLYEARRQRQRAPAPPPRPTVHP